MLVVSYHSAAEPWSTKSPEQLSYLYAHHCKLLFRLKRGTFHGIAGGGAGRQDLLLRLHTNCMTFTFFMYLSVCRWKEGQKTCKQTHVQLGWYLHLLTKPLRWQALSSHNRAARGQLPLPCVSTTTLKCHDFLCLSFKLGILDKHVRRLSVMTAACQFYFIDSGLGLLDSWLLCCGS